MLRGVGSESFPKNKVLVIGDVMLDEYVWSTVTRISPESPVPVAEVQSTTYAPGGAANVALNIATLGGDPLLIGIVGNDPAGDLLKTELKSMNIPTKQILTIGTRQTTHKTRIIAHNQHLVRVDREDKDHVTADVTTKLIKAFDKLIDSVDSVILVDYQKGSLTTDLTEHIIKKSKSKSKPVSVCLKNEDIDKYRGANIVSLHVDDAEVASRITLMTEKNIQKIGLKLLTMLESNLLVINQLAKGVMLFFPDRPSFQVPGSISDILDSARLDDALISVLSLAHLNDFNLVDSSEIINGLIHQLLEKTNPNTN